MPTEAFTWPEGTAYLITGGASATAFYARDINVACQVGYHKYRPPHSNVYEQYETGREASMQLGQVYGPQDALTMFDGATGGGAHLHLVHVADGGETTATCTLYSGSLDSVALDGAEGRGEQTIRVAGQFVDWSFG